MNNFTLHFHPTVAIYADSFLTGKPQPKPDLGLYTLAHFLDRFVYKNAKAKATTKGSSIMQPLGGAHTGSLLVKATNTGSSEVPVNTMNWLAQKAEDVRPDERFFHQYFSTNAKKIRNKKASAAESDDEKEDMDDDEVWEALVNSKPEVEGDDLSDEDILSDLDNEDFSDSDNEDEEEVDPETLAETFGDDDLSEGDMPEIDEAAFETNKASDGDEEESGSNVTEGEEDADAFDDEEGPGMFGVDEDDEYDSDELVESRKKRAHAEEKPDKKTKKKAKLLSLPTFADASDYAKYLDSDGE